MQGVGFMKIKTIFVKIKEFLTKKRKNPININDFLFLCGLFLLFMGLWMHNPWLAPTVTGSVMILTGLFGKK